MQSFYIIEYILYAMFDTFCVELYFVLIFRFGRIMRTSFDIKGTTLQNCSFVLQLSQQSVFSFGCALFLALKQ